MRAHELVYIYMYLQCWHVWCHMILLPSRHVMCTPYNHAPCHFMQSHIRTIHAYLAVTSHLHVWQNDRCLLRATSSLVRSLCGCVGHAVSRLCSLCGCVGHAVSRQCSLCGCVGHAVSRLYSLCGCAVAALWQTGQKAAARRDTDKIKMLIVEKFRFCSFK